HVFHTPFESMSASMRPFGGSAVDSVRTIDTSINSLHSFRGLDVATSFLSGPTATWHGNAIDVGRPLPVPVSLQAPTMDARGGHDFGAGPSLQDEINFLAGVDQDGLVTDTSYWTWKRDNPASFANKSTVAKWGSDHTTTD